MKHSIVIPTAIQLCLDDVAWHNGRDERSLGKPSRSGLPRDHAPEDYRIINELGKAIDMKILCPLCLGEWDKDNLLRGQVGITFDPANWNRAALINYPLAERYLEAAEQSTHLEYAVHGLLHGNYDENGKQLGEQEYFAPRKKEDGSYTKERYPISMEDLKRRLDLFQAIYDSWGFQKKIRTIVSPGGVLPLPVEAFADFAEEFQSRGLVYWPNGWWQLKQPMELLNGVALLRECSSGRFAPWNGYDCDPSLFPDYDSEQTPLLPGVFGLHWTNFLRYHPQNNMEYLPAWIQYFRRQSEIFGLLLSKDIAFAANQLAYACHAVLTFTEENGIKKCLVDVSVPKRLQRPHKKQEFYISFQNRLLPKECKDASLELYETHQQFKTYRIRHEQDRLEIYL